MATVTSQLTRILDMEGALTLTSIGGGAGAAANTDIFIQGAQSAGRRQSNVTVNGFLVDDGTPGVDLSAANVHVGMWMWITHYGSLTALRARIASNSGTADYDEHTVPLTEYPSLGGWIRVWLDISRTPDFTGGTALNEAAARHYGVTISLPTVGGNAANLILDAVDHTTTGLLLTGTSGVWQDFLTADEGNTTNKYGVVTSASEIISCRARLTLGSASSLVFTDSDFVIVFPQQNLVASNFMGVTCDLQNASTNISMTGGSFQSPGAVKGDFIVTGTSGDLTLSSCTFSGLRALTFTAGVVATSCAFNTCGLITHGSATLSSCSVVNATGAVAILTSAPNLISDCSFTSDGTGHAIEISATGTFTFAGNTFSGYAGTNGSTGNEAIYNNSGGAVTLNITNGGDTPTYRNGAGASTTIVNAVNVTLEPLIADSEVRVYLGSISSASSATELAGVESSTTSFSFSHSSPGSSAYIVVHKENYENLVVPILLPSSDSTIPIQQRVDRNYLNP